MSGYHFGEVMSPYQLLYGVLLPRLQFIQNSQTVNEIANEGSELLQLVMERPIAALSILVIVAVIVALVVFKILDYLQSPSDRFLNVVSKSDKITVLMHNNPDPDAMASAMGISRLAEEVGTE